MRNSEIGQRIAQWSVTVTLEGETLLTIETGCVAGKTLKVVRAPLSEGEKQTICLAAAHLEAFIGC